MWSSMVTSLCACSFWRSLLASSTRFSRGASTVDFSAALHSAISAHDAGRDRSMSPNLDIVCSIKGIAGGMIEVIVGIEGGFYRDLTHATKSIHLERSSRRADKTLDQKRAVFSGKETAVAHGLQALGGIGNSGVEAIADSADRRETLVRHHRLGQARIVLQRGNQWP